MTVLRPRVLIGFLLLILPGLLLAGTGGKIAGKVTDAKTGEALPGANVVIDGTSMGSSTSGRGWYLVQPPSRTSATRAA